MDDEIARRQVVRSPAFTHVNEVCKKAMLTLPKKAKPILQDYIQVVMELVPMMAPGCPGRRDQHHRTVAAATEVTETPAAMPTPRTLGQMTRPSRGPAGRPCALCGKKGRWWQACPLKQEFHKFRGSKESGKKGGQGG